LSGVLRLQPIDDQGRAGAEDHGPFDYVPRLLQRWGK